MLHGTSSPGFAGSELTHLLGRLSEAPPPTNRPVLAERLGHWLGWTGAIALAAALDGRPAARPVTATRQTAAADFDRVRAALDAGNAAGPQERLPLPADFAPWRRHCLARQQAMQEAVAALRQRLRDTLAQRSSQGARLAALDAVLDPSLAPHERSLLGLVPLRLQAHFDRLQRHASDDPRWPDTFRADVARVLRAELAHRLQPAQGLLDALTTDLTP